jgi:hypothetical protein
MQRLLGLFGANGSGGVGGPLALHKKHTLSDEEAANELAELVPKGRGSGTAAASSSIGSGSGGTVRLVVSCAVLGGACWPLLPLLLLLCACQQQFLLEPRPNCILRWEPPNTRSLAYVPEFVPATAVGAWNALLLLLHSSGVSSEVRAADASWPASTPASLPACTSACGPPPAQHT